MDIHIDNDTPDEVNLALIEASARIDLARIEANKEASIADIPHATERLNAQRLLEAEKTAGQMQIVRARAEHADVEMMLISEKAKADLALAHARNKTIITICGMLFVGLATTVLGVSCMLF